MLTMENTARRPPALAHQDSRFRLPFYGFPEAVFLLSFSFSRSKLNYFPLFHWAVESIFLTLIGQSSIHHGARQLLPQ